MTNVCRCPSCAQPIDVSACEPNAAVNCPTCGTKFAVSAPGGQAGLATSTSWTPPVVSRAATTRKKAKQAPAAIVAVLVSAGLLLVVVLAVAANRGGGENSDQRGLSSTKPVARKPTANPAARPDAAPQSVRAPLSRAANSTTSDRATDEPDRVMPTEAAEENVTAGAAPASATDASRPAPALAAASAALANALLSAERPVTGEPTGASAASPATGAPKDYQVTASKDAPDGDDAKDLSLAEKRRLAEIAKLKKMIQRHFIAQRRTSDRSRGQVEDFFVVAKYEMPLATRVADVRFEVTEAIEPSVNQVSDYLLATSSGVMRDFQVVARFGSMSDADEGIVAVRQQYDQAKEYQAQLLAFLQAQQRFQASSIRRC